MKINIRNDSVEIEGYVNAVERDSKVLHSRTGPFIERICKGAFARAREVDLSRTLALRPCEFAAQTPML